MLAARDQENLIHGHQTIGAAKSSTLNRPLPPKTPGAKVPKTPFKVPLNDENNVGGFGAGKSLLRAVEKGTDNAYAVGKKPAFNADAFKTPIAPRAPLGQKTTNAKAKALTNTTLALPDNDLAKSRQKSASARKKGPRISHAEPVRVDVLTDKDIEDGFDIGVTHPRPKDLDDFEGELPAINLSVLEGGFRHSGILRDIYNMPCVDGMSMTEMREKQDVEDRRVNELLTEATCRRQVDLSMPMLCRHEPECLWECKDEPARREKIMAESEKEVHAIRATWKIIDRLKYRKEAAQMAEEAKKQKRKQESQKAASRMPKTTIVPPKPSTTSSSKPKPLFGAGPPSSLSRAAASKLAIQPPRPAAAPAAAPSKPPRFPAALSRKPSAPTPAPAGQSMRYAGARAVSNTSMGYAKGRAVSAQRRGTVLPRSDKDVFSAPGLGSGLLKGQNADATNDGGEDVEREQTEEERALDAALLEDALQEFVLSLPED